MGNGRGSLKLSARYNKKWSQHMRVVHISPADTDGGASKGAYRLHTALRPYGVDSKMLVQRKYTDDPSVITTRKSYVAMFEGLRGRFDTLPLKLSNRESHTRRTDGWVTFAHEGAGSDHQQDHDHFPSDV